MTVCILLSTYNGSKYIKEQLASISIQKGVDWMLCVRDDGSSDNTMEILTTQMEGNNYKILTSSDNLKPAKSFFTLMMEAPEADYYALCDQDDVWDDLKLLSAIDKLQETPKDKPALYFSQTTIVDENLQPLPTKTIHPLCTFYESLIINQATGCTFVFNKKLLELARKYNPQFLWMHDVWLYKLCISIGGDVYFDPVSHIKYRQHKNNVIGLSGGKWKGLKQKYKRTQNKECERSNTFKELYAGYKDMLLPEYLPIIEQICNYKHSPLSLLKLIFNSRIRCNDWKANLSMRIALLLHTY